MNSSDTNRAASDTPALQIEKLHYSYITDWTRSAIPTLKNVSLDVQPGEFFGFLGPNGAGKTTTIKSVLGLIRPTQGQVKIFGLDSRLAAARQAVGYLPEHPYFYDYLSVSEIMEMYATLTGLRGAERYEAVKRALATVGLSDRGKYRMRSLSKGLMQRVALAQAIVAKPRLLILDEPFSGLDPLGRREFREILLGLKSAGTTIFMSSHILGDVQFLCDRVSIMAKGELKTVLALADLPKISPGHYELTVRTETGLADRLRELAPNLVERQGILAISVDKRELAEEIARRVLDARGMLESYQYVHGSLEELFVKLVGSAPLEAEEHCAAIPQPATTL